MCPGNDTELLNKARQFISHKSSGISHVCSKHEINCLFLLYRLVRFSYIMLNNIQLIYSLASDIPTWISRTLQVPSIWGRIVTFFADEEEKKEAASGRRSLIKLEPKLDISWKNKTSKLGRWRHLRNLRTGTNGNQKLNWGVANCMGDGM